MVRPQRPRRVPPSLVAEVDRRRGRGVPRTPRDRHLQQLERARELQRAPARSRRVGEAWRAPVRWVPARVPGDVARRVAHEADDDALPEPHGDGRRGVDPGEPARRRRPAHRLRQDEPRQRARRREREHPDDRRHGRADAERPVARARARVVQRLLALQRGAPGGPDHRGGAHRDRELALALERALHDDGHGVDHGLRHGGARADPARRRCDPGRRLAPRQARRGSRQADRRARRAGPEAERHPRPRGLRERDPGAPRDLGLDERDPAPDRLRGPRRGRRPAPPLRRAERDDARGS